MKKDNRQTYQQNDAVEEVEERFDGDLDLGDYILVFDVECSWPNDKDQMTFKGTYAYPLFLDNDAIKPFFPYFNDFFDVIGIDRLHDVIEVRISDGKNKTDLRIHLNESETYEFEYYQNKLKRSSLKKGKATFSFYHFDFDGTTIPGKIVFEEFYNVNGSNDDYETHEFSLISDNEDKSGSIDLDSGDQIYICLTDYYHNFVLLYGFTECKKAKDGIATVYYPLWLNKKTIETTTFKDGSDNIEIKTNISYIESKIDNYDFKCHLAITEFGNGQTTNYQMDIMDSNHIQLSNSSAHIHLARINSKEHELAVYIGDSHRRFDNNFFTINLRNHAICEVNGYKIKVEVIKNECD